MTNKYTPILTVNEARDFSGLGDRYPACDLVSILQVEMAEFRECLGKEFHNVLRDALADYSSAETWKTGTTYTAGAVVKSNGAYFKAKADTTTEPSNKQFWGIAPRFDTAKPCGELYNAFWCMFLGPYLAHKVYRRTIGINLTETAAFGEVVKVGPDFIAAGENRIQRKYAAIDTAIFELYKNMQQFVAENNTDGCFNKVKWLGKDCCKECGEITDACSCQCEDCTEKLARAGGHLIV